MGKLDGYPLSLMIPPWHRPKIRIVDLPNEYLGSWYYLYDKKKGSHREFYPRPPTAPTPKAVSKKRPYVEALESTPPVAPQLAPPAPIEEPIPLLEMVIVDIPMVKQEPLVPLQAPTSNSKIHRNHLACECKHWQKDLLAKQDTS